MRIALRRAHLLALAAALWCVPTSAAAQPKAAPAAPPALSERAELDRATGLYDAGKYPDCVKEFDGLIGREPKKLKDPDVLERARIYYAACLIGTNQVPRAEEQMRAAIRANPNMRAPDTLVFPGPVIDRFFKVRDSLIDEIKAAQAAELKKKREEAAAAARRAAAEERRVKALEERASHEIVVTRNNRWVAALPFGVGQFQNRDPVLGWVFLGSEAALAGTALGALILELRLNATSDDDPPPDPADLNSKLHTTHQVLTISSWGFLAVATVGVLQAELSFVPELRETVKKPLPRELRRPRAPPAPGVSLAPVFGFVPGSGAVGMSGRF